MNVVWSVIFPTANTNATINKLQHVIVTTGLQTREVCQATSGNPRTPPVENAAPRPQWTQPQPPHNNLEASGSTNMLASMQMSSGGPHASQPPVRKSAVEAARIGRIVKRSRSGPRWISARRLQVHVCLDVTGIDHRHGSIMLITF
jgi:hypothetical protein